jgi:hypothetical protein
MTGVPSVGSGAQNPPSSPTVVVRAKKWGSRVIKYLKPPSDLAKIFRNVTDCVGLFRNLSKSVKTAVQVTKGFNVISGMVATKDAVQDVRRVIDRTKKPSERIKSSFLFIGHLDSVTKGISTICGLLKTFGAASAKVVQWIPIYQYISFAVGFIWLGLSAYSAHQARKLQRSLSVCVESFMHAQNDTEKMVSLEQMLDVVQRQGIEPLRRHLMMSKAGGVELTKRVDALKKHIGVSRGTAPDVSLTEQEKQLVTKAEQERFMKVLAGRAKMKLGFEVTEVASNVTKTVAGVLEIVPVPVVAQVIGISLIISTAVVSLVSWGGRRYFINKNPLDLTSKSRALQAVDSLSNAFASLRHRLQQLIAVQRHPTPSPA